MAQQEQRNIEGTLLLGGIARDEKALKTLGIGL